MKQAQPIAETIMQKCIHLLDKYPVPLNVIGEVRTIAILSRKLFGAEDTVEPASWD